jgi:hypothetical protein
MLTRVFGNLAEFMTCAGSKSPWVHVSLFVTLLLVLVILARVVPGVYHLAHQVAGYQYLPILVSSRISGQGYR